MAEIHVERRHARVWPWVLGALALLAVVWVFLAARDGGDELAYNRPQTGEQVGGSAGAVGTAGANVDRFTPPVESFASFVQGDFSSRVDASHEPTAEGLRHLAAALNGVAGRDNLGSRIQGQVGVILEQAGQLDTPGATTHADLVRAAFIAAAEAMATLHEGRYQERSSQVSSLRQTAETLNPETPLLQQRDVVTRFFNEASTVLQTRIGRT